MLAAGPAAARIADPVRDDQLIDYDPVRSELVLNIVVLCAKPVPMGPASASKDGERKEFYPILGGRFFGKGLRGTVVPGGADFPVLRPDGVFVIDALYRLLTDDGTTIIIHNRGLTYPKQPGQPERSRLTPEFTAPKGPYDWLNKSIFVSTIVEAVPPSLRLAHGEDEMDLLIQVHRLV